MVKSILKRVVSSVTGYWFYKEKHLPVGADMFVDLIRLVGDNTKVVLDVGANIGQTTLKYSQMFAGANIFSFEPVNESFNLLQKNTRNLKNVTCFNFALGESNGNVEITLNNNPHCSQNSLKPELMNEDPKAKKQYVKVCKLKDVLQEKNITNVDLLKIDTEGWEIKVLKGCEEYLFSKKIRFILCEVGFTEWNKRNTNFFELNAYLNKCGYLFYGLYDLSHLQIRSGKHYGNALYIASESELPK